jgi:hypothetical protein
MPSQGGDMSTRKPVRRRDRADDTWTKSPACRAGGNSWGRRAARGCHVA